MEKNRNGDENNGGGEEVGAEDGEKEKIPRPSAANLIRPSPTPPTLINLIYRNCNVLPLCLGDFLNHTK
jgi:hypothetical protein